MPDRRLASRAAFFGGGLSVGAVAGYLLTIAREGEGFSSRIWFVAGWLAVGAALLLVAAYTSHPPRRAALAGVAASMLITMGWAGSMTIGLLFLVPGLIGGGGAYSAAVESGMPLWRRVAAAVLLGIAVTAGLLVGLLLTS